MRSGRSCLGSAERLPRRDARAAIAAIAVAVATASVSGCSSVLSKADTLHKERQRKGLAYWLPKRDIVVTVTVTRNEDKELETAVAVAAGPMQPDHDGRQFLIGHLPNWIGTNQVNVTVNAKGLLGKVTSVTTIKLGEALAEIAGGPPVARIREQQDQCGPGTYERFVQATHGERGTVCNFQIIVCRLFPDGLMQADDPIGFYSPQGLSGIYYRQELPYRVEVAPQGSTEPTCPTAPKAPKKVEPKSEASKDETPTKRSFLVFSPSESPTYFLPVRKTLFSNNKADFEFSEGVPTKYDQSTDGELIGLLKLPADVIGAYFGAMGEIFKYRKQSLESEQQLLASQAKLAAEIVRLQACKDAVDAGVKGDELKALCGGS